jgi:hypothetical protein
VCDEVREEEAREDEGEGEGKGKGESEGEGKGETKGEGEGVSVKKGSRRRKVLGLEGLCASGRTACFLMQNHNVNNTGYAF